MNLRHLPKDMYFHTTNLKRLGDQILPEEFTWRLKAPQCMVPVIDQGECGSCYAHATSSMLAERLCINQRDLQMEVVPLAPNSIMSCDPESYGCNGGMINHVLEYLEQVGIPSNACLGGYSNISYEECPTTCKNGDAPDYSVGCAPKSRRQVIGEEQIKQEILSQGPVASQMVVYEDLLTYKEGVYYHREGSIIGGHAVLIVGWGPGYWEVQNSWGTEWGENGGFFRIKTGDSEIATELFGGGFSCLPEIKASKSEFLQSY